MVNLLAGLPEGPVSVQSVFAQLDGDLATAVEGFWAARARLTGCVPHRRVCSVGPPALELFAQSLPQRCLGLLSLGPLAST